MIETEVRPAPAEPTTPIKPSEAIRLGCLIAPEQIRAGLFDGLQRACVIGAMALGYGWDGPTDRAVLMGDVRPLLPAIPDLIFDKLWQLNDGLTTASAGPMPRERIADWLAEQGL